VNQSIVFLLTRWMINVLIKKDERKVYK